MGGISGWWVESHSVTRTIATSDNTNQQETSSGVVEAVLKVSVRDTHVLICFDIDHFNTIYFSDLA